MTLRTGLLWCVICVKITNGKYFTQPDREIGLGHVESSGHLSLRGTNNSHNACRSHVLVTLTNLILPSPSPLFDSVSPFLRLNTLETFLPSSLSHDLAPIPTCHASQDGGTRLNVPGARAIRRRHPSWTSLKIHLVASTKLLPAASFEHVSRACATQIMVISLVAFLPCFWPVTI